ncbi:MAG: hypothetical protein Q8O19_02870 [Rectinemataceae bacterium]|nr:hypothetical protein [Rectinemataceae bacterium]
MQTLQSKSAAISFVILALVALGLLYYFLIYKNQQPESVTLYTYVCADGSFYLVRVNDGTIEVAGARYNLVSEEGVMRYEGAGPMAFTINGQALSVSFKESGEAIATCAQGPIENMPVVEA